MSRDVDAVFAAIERWTRAGLIDPETAGTLRSEAEEEAVLGTRRLSQHVLAATAGAILLIAAGLFIGWSWAFMGVPLRAGLLGASALLLFAAGLSSHLTYRWIPVAYGLQSAALALGLVAVSYSSRAWPDASVGGMTAGGGALVVPLVLIGRLGRADSVLPALYFLFSLGYLAVGLDRALGISEEAILWVLDAVLVVVLVFLQRTLRGDRDEERYPWALNVFATAVTSGFVLVGLTAAGPLDMDGLTVLPLDAWLLMAVWMTVRAIGSDDFGDRRAWLGQLLAAQVLIAIPLGFLTVLETLDGPPELAAAVVGGIGVLAFLYARGESLRQVIGAGAFAFVCGVWYWGVERGGALGAVFALVFTAAALFWISGRTGRAEA